MPKAKPKATSKAKPAAKPKAASKPKVASKPKAKTSGNKAMPKAAPTKAATKKVAVKAAPKKATTKKVAVKAAPKKATTKKVAVKAAPKPVKKVYHVKPAEKAGWIVVLDGAKTPSGRFDKKLDAVARGKELCSKPRLAQLVIHKADGKVQDKVDFKK